MEDKIEEIITPILAQYINDAECKVFHSHDDVFLAQKIAQQIRDALIPQGDEDLREKIVNILFALCTDHNFASIADRCSQSESPDIVGLIDMPQFKEAVKHLSALTKSLEPQIEGASIPAGPGIEGDGGGLLSEELWNEILDTHWRSGAKYDSPAWIAMREAQASLSIRLERERIFNEIDNRNLYILTKDCNNPSPEDWQSLREGK